MAILMVREASAAELNRWDDCIESAFNGTLFHRLDFLGYHGDRFRGQERFLVVLDGDSIVARIPLAVREENGRRVAHSPYGGSVGGFVFARQPGYALSHAITMAFLAYLKEEHIDAAVLTPPPGCWAPESLDTVSFALLEAGFRSSNRDITSVVRLPAAAPVADIVSGRARNMARKAEKMGVEIVHRAEIDEFWPVMEATFAKHGARPTHSRGELSDLLARLPGRIWLDIARADGRAVAGACFFAVTPSVNTSFYLCQDPARQALQGLSLLVLTGLERSRKEGFSWFDFGTSTVSMQARESVFRFKENYGLTGVFRETFRWQCPI